MKLTVRPPGPRGAAVRFVVPLGDRAVRHPGLRRGPGRPGCRTFGRVQAGRAPDRDDAHHPHPHQHPRFAAHSARGDADPGDGRERGRHVRESGPRRRRPGRQGRPGPRGGPACHRRGLRSRRSPARAAGVAARQPRQPRQPRGPCRGRAGRRGAVHPGDQRLVRAPQVAQELRPAAQPGGRRRTGRRRTRRCRWPGPRRVALPHRRPGPGADGFARNSGADRFARDPGADRFARDPRNARCGTVVPRRNRPGGHASRRGAAPRYGSSGLAGRAHHRARQR